MKVVCLLTARLKPLVRAAAGLSVLSVALAAGCAEKAVEEAPQDVEKARQDHIKMMQRESGQTMPPEKSDSP